MLPADTVRAFREVRQSRSLTFLTLGRALRSFGQSYLGVMVPLYLLARGESVAQAGLLVTAWAAGTALLGAGAGFASDRYGRKRVLFAFSVLTSIAALIFYAGPPLWVLAIAGALGTIGRGGGPVSGGGFGPFYSAEQALIAEHVEHHARNHVFALFSLAGALGGALGFVMTGLPQLFLVLHVGGELAAYRVVFLCTAVIGVLLAATVGPIEEVTQRHNADRNREHAALTARTRSLVARFWITNSANGLAIGFLGPMLVLWFHLRYGATSQQIGAIYLVIALASAGSYMFVGSVVRRIGGAVKSVVLLRLCSCGLLAAMPFMPTLWLAGLVYLFRMIFNSVTMPIRQSYVMGIVPRAERSRVASLSNLPSQLFSMVGPSVAGVLMRETWIGVVLEAAAALQLLNAGAYWAFFAKVLPPEER